MKIQFESNQQFQLDAIQAVLDVFDGQPLAQGEYEIGSRGSRGRALNINFSEAGC